MLPLPGGWNPRVDLPRARRTKQIAGSAPASTYAAAAAHRPGREEVPSYRLPKGMWAVRGMDDGAEDGGRGDVETHYRYATRMARMRGGRARKVDVLCWKGERDQQ